MKIGFNSNQIFANDIFPIWIRIVWRLKYLVVHIHPWITCFVFHQSEMNSGRKSYIHTLPLAIYILIIRFEFHHHIIRWDRNNFFVPVAGRIFRFWTLIWTWQSSYQYWSWTFISINFVYWDGITIIRFMKLWGIPIFIRPPLGMVVSRSYPRSILSTFVKKFIPPFCFFASFFFHVNDR